MSPRDPIAFHDEFASAWDDRYRSGGFKRRADFFRGRILPALPQGGRWLDSGCGSGYFSRLISPSRKVIGVDGSQEMIASAIALAEAEALSDACVFYKVASLERLTFPDSYFDGCLCLSVIEYLPDPEAALSELSRVLVPGGVIVVSVPNARSVVRWMQERYRKIGAASSDYLEHSRYSVGQNEFRQSLAGAGFVDISLRSFDPLLPKVLQPVVPSSLIFGVARKARHAD